MKATKKKPAKNENLQNEEQNIDKVRDILFGNQVRDFERRFAKLEERFNENIAETREETQKKLDELEEFINREVSALTERITTEQHSRQDDVKKLSSELQNNSHDFDKKLSSMGEKTAKNESEIRQKILDQSKSLTDDMKKRQEDIMAKLKRESDELREDKADRIAIAEIFTEMAMRLTGDTKSPKED
jgi:DNA repair exonuclease SbcCD ATPase subunit